ncbi:SAV_915 family protein [Streptomyces sp. NPDC088341]|uniref:SAV_915 family protein n=1 Tax=Streptomyces sp. NPDC088341 TaxID=3154870 RepID=UPI0034414D2C
MERLITEDAGTEPGSDRGSARGAGPASDPDPDPDPDPGPDTALDEGRAAARPLYVPVRLGSCGGQQLRFARTPLGARTAIAFTSARRLTAVLGEQQAWIRLAEPVLRELAAPLGAAIVTVDPQLTAPAPVPAPAPAPRPAPVRTCARHAPELPEAMSV